MVRVASLCALPGLSPARVPRKEERGRGTCCFAGANGSCFALRAVRCQQGLGEEQRGAGVSADRHHSLNTELNNSSFFSFPGKPCAPIAWVLQAARLWRDGHAATTLTTPAVGTAVRAGQKAI